MIRLFKRREDDPHIPMEDPRHTAHCVIPGCFRRPWGASEQILNDFLLRDGWKKTPHGWMCGTHVRQALATAYVVANADPTEREYSGIAPANRRCPEIEGGGAQCRKFENHTGACEVYSERYGGSSHIAWRYKAGPWRPLPEDNS